MRRALIPMVMIVVGCGTQTSTRLPAAPATADIDLVRAALLDTIARRLGATKMLVSNLTWVPGDGVTSVIADRLRERAAPEDMLADFRARASTRAVLGSLSATPPGVVFIAPSELVPRDGEAADDFWQRLRATHAPANGWLQTTGVGFSSDRSAAMAAAEYKCGTRCGWGVAYTFSHQANGWRVADEVFLWIN